MKELPKSEVYEQEFEFLPWGFLINSVLTIIEKEVPKNGSVLDLMCGSGYLLGEIAKRRSDINLEGVDISKEFIHYAQCKYPNILFQAANVLSYDLTKKYDLVVCTGGVHHLPYDKQELFLEKVLNFLKPKGFAILADPFIDDFFNEMERKQAAAKLGYGYVTTTINNNAPRDIIKATIDILYNDVMGFEYKTSIKKIEPILRKLFSFVEITKVWPESKSEYGDYYIICKNDS